MASYTASFKTLKGDTIRIEISGASGGEELILAGEEPVMIEYVQDDVFSPLKMSTCSVRVITDVPILGLFTGTLSDVSLSVYRTGNAEGASEEMIWYGFMSPNVYSMPYDSKNNELSLEFVDPLNAMESVKFAYFPKTGDHVFATFEDFINQALNDVGASSVITNISGMPSDLDGVGCMERNYIDETDDEDDGAMTWQQVMESILRYMNKTAYIYGNTFYIYDPLDTDGKTAKSITDLGIADSSGTISLGEVYNKVTVVANNNPEDALLPDILDKSDFSSITSIMPSGSTLITDEMGGYVLKNAWYRSNGKDFTQSFNIITYTETFMEDDGNYLTYDYTSSIYPDLEQRHHEESNEHYVGTMVSKIICVQMGAAYNKTDGVPSSLTYSKYLTFGRLLDGSGDTLGSVTVNSRSMFIGWKGYFIISLKYKRTVELYAQEYINCTYDSKTDEDDVFICKLQVGNRYWNGSEWTTEESSFTMTHTVETNDQGVKEESVYTDHSIDNMVTFDLNLGTDKEGWLIALPTDSVLFGDVIFTIAPPYKLSSYLHISEMNITYAAQDTVEDIFNLQEYEPDLTYTGNLDEGNIKEADDVEFTTNTWTSKAVSYSYAMKQSDGKYTYVTPEDDELNPEQKCIERMVTYYSSPRLTYQIGVNDVYGKYISPVDNISASYIGKTFTVGGVTYDLMDNSAEVTLLEVP